MKIFWEKYNKNKTIIELSLLPPCRANLIHHLKRINYVSYLMRSASFKPDIDHYTEHGWTADGGSIWSQEHIPDDIQQIQYDDAIAHQVDDEEIDEEDEFDENTDPEGCEDDDIEMVDYSV